ncbi:hypothetical protein Tco_0749603 [Tanacetum coccineum]|uniref:Uncharacterized protein n=1 Tax=Tanacetum coccineum TaxID=301880 RepID=A0ABQ4Z1M8_9ASTR
MEGVSIKQRLAGKKSLKTQWMQKEFVSKHGRKPAKAKPSVRKDPLFDELADDKLDYIDTKNAQDVERTRNVVFEEKRVLKMQSRVSTNKEVVNTDRLEEGSNDQTEGRSATSTTQTPTPTTFGDDETIAQVLLNMSQAKAVSREKEKEVELKDVEETERPGPTSTKSLLTLKPLLKIDPKDKGKKKIEEQDESDTEFEGIPEAKKKFKQLARDEEMARKVQENWEAEEEMIDLATKLFKMKRKRSSLLEERDVTEQGTKKRKGGHIKMLVRKRKRPQSDVDSDDEHRKYLKIVTFEDGTIMFIYKGKSELQSIQLSIRRFEDMMESSTEEMIKSDLWNDQQDLGDCYLEIVMKLD